MTMRFWIRKLFTRPVTRTVRTAPRRVRLAIEELEARCCPSITTITVLTNGDGSGSLTSTGTNTYTAPTLRAAIAGANTMAVALTSFDFAIDFGSLFNTAQTITLGGTQLPDLVSPGGGRLVTVTITGSTGGVTVSGNLQSRVFEFGPDVAASISGMTITAGKTTGNGVTGRGAGAQGAGVYCYGATTLSMTNCTISGNSASEGGGGVYSAFGATLTNCTVSGNNGGGVFNYNGTATLTNCTVSGNNGGNGGGLTTIFGTATLTNTIVAGNTGSSDPDIYNYEATLNGSYDLIENTNGWSSSGFSNLITNENPLLAGLSNYGGTTQTMALLPGSPAIAAGTSTGAPSTDQRGVSRVGHVDIGAFQSSGFTIAVTSGSGQSTGSSTAFANPLVATITANNSSEPVAGGLVTFTPPVSTASATLSGSPATISVSGTASVTATANSGVGSYTVSATASGITTPASFGLTNYGLDHFVIGTIGTQTADTPFDITITAEYVNDAIDTTYTGTVTIGYGSLSGSPTTSAAFVAGQLSSQSVDITTAAGGSTSLTVTDTGGSGKTGVSNTFTVNAAALDHFVIGTITTPQTAHTAFDISVTAEYADGSTDTSFTGTVTIGYGSLSGGPTTSASFVSGQLSSQSVDITTAAGGSTSLTVTAAGGSGKTGVSNTFTVNAATLDHFAIGTIGTQTGDTPFDITITAEYVDGSTDTSYTGTVTIDYGSLSGSPTTSAAFVAGQLSSQSVDITTAAGGSTSLTVTATGGSASGTSNTFTVNAAALDHFAIGTITTQTADTPFAVSVTAEYADGSTDTSFTDTVTIDYGSLSGSPTTSASFVSGQLSSQSVDITTAAGGSTSLTVTATGGSAGGTSNTFTVNPPVSLGALSFAQWTVGKAGYSGTITVSGGTGALSNLAVVSGSLPAGLNQPVLSGNTITITGTPTTVGTFSFTLSLDDSQGAVGSQSYTFTVDPATTLAWTGLGPNDDWNNAANWSGAAPAAGDTLIFGAGAAQLTNVNNLTASIKLASLVFQSSGYSITGNAIDLSGGISDTSTVAGTDAIALNIALTANQTLTVAPGDLLQLSGALSGNFGVTKAGTGTLDYSGATANSYTGTTTVSSGLLELDKTGVTAIARAMTVDSGATAQYEANNQIAAAAPVTVMGTLDLNGNSGTIRALTLSGGTVETESGTLTLGGNITASGTATITGLLGLGTTTRTVTVAAANDLVISADISGAAGVGLTKAGTGELTLDPSSSNTYTGTTTVSAGVLDVQSSSALGAGTAVKVTKGATLQLDGGLTVNKTLTLGTPTTTVPGGGGTLLSTTGTNTWAGSIHLAFTSTINVSAASPLTISNVISGAGGLTKSGGTGTLILSGANSYKGTTTVSAGVLGGSGTVAGAVRVSSGATLAPGSTVTAILNTRNVTLVSGSTFTVTLNGSAAGTDYDQLNVTGTVNLGSASLHINLLSTSVGDTFTIIQNDGSDAVVGTFAGLAEGATFTQGGATFTISYKGGTGNDVVLRRTA